MTKRLSSFSSSFPFLLLVLTVLASLCALRTGAWGLATTHPHHLHLHLHLHLLQRSSAQRRASATTTSAAAWFGGSYFRLRSTASEGGISDEGGKKKMSRAARRDLVKRALQAYKDMFGNLLVHQKFVIPEGSDLWGLKLGSIVNTVRNNNYYKELRPELEEMGFDYDPQPIGYGWDGEEGAAGLRENI
jgi:hypothetical protein